MNILVSSPAMTLLGSSHSSLLAFAQENIYLVSGRAGRRESRAVWYHSPLSISPQRSLTGAAQLAAGLTGACTGCLSHQDSKAGEQLKPEESKRSEVTTKLQDRSRISHLKCPAWLFASQQSLLSAHIHIYCTLEGQQRDQNLFRLKFKSNLSGLG